MNRGFSANSRWISELGQRSTLMLQIATIAMSHLEVTKSKPKEVKQTSVALVVGCL